MGVLSNAISQARQLQLTAGEHILSGAPTASATKALLRMGSAIAGGNSNGAYIGINAPTNYAGDIFFAQIDSGSSPIGFAIRGDGAGKLRVGIGGAPTQRKLEVRGEANNRLDACVEIRNNTNDTGVGAELSLSTSGCSGFFTAFPSGFTGTAAFADRVVLGANSDASGFVFNANAASQDFRWLVGTLGEQLRLSESGELLLGTTSSLARMAVVGRSDQIQLLVRSNGTQNANLITVQNSAGTQTMLGLTGSNVFTVHNTGGTAQLTFNPAGGLGLFIANQSGQNLTVTGVADSNKIICARARASQSGSLFEAQQNASMGGGGFGLWVIDSAGDMLFWRQSSTTSGRGAAAIRAGFVVSTDASRTGYLQLEAEDFNGQRVFLRGEADGTRALVSSTARWTITAPALDQIPLAVVSAASQTANLQEWRTSTPTTIAAITAAGRLILNNGVTASKFMVGPTAIAAIADTEAYILSSVTTNSGLIIRGIASQTADLIRLQDNVTNVCPLFAVSAAGDVIWQRRTTTSPNNRQAAKMTIDFAVTADATREGRITIVASDFNGDRTILEGRADGTNPKIGFLGTAAFRATGWGAPTGTATRTTFDTTTVTLAQLAERTKALIDDMRVSSGYGLLQA